MRDYGRARSQRRGRAVSFGSGLRRKAACALATGVLCTGLAGAIVQATPASAASSHSYRHGLVPNLHYYLSHKSQFVHALSANDLNYGGGVAGIGVTTGKENVYLVFWGYQWGTQGTNSNGYNTYSGDPSGIAPILQAFFKGLGTGSGSTQDLWSGVMTQYCEGVATGTQTCPASNTSHVAYPTGGALAGVWEDTSAAAPATASGHQIGVEAENAATHFGNTTTASNRDDQYVIISPTGTDPDNYQSQGFCAWHDYTGDTTLTGGSVSGSTLSFTNLPYIPDAGSGCGANFNNLGANAGVTIVEGHEYAETITDQNPAGGWTDSSGSENGDKCAWIATGSPGASANITLTTGTFPVQSTWANDANSGSGGCDISHPIVTNPGGNTVTVTNPGNQTSTVGTPVSLQIQASDSGGATLTYSASGLPAGLSINSSSGLISGTPTTSGSSSTTVTATDTTGASGSATFTWTVNPSGGGGGITNGGFETGSLSGWTGSGAAFGVTTSGPHSGTYAALLGSSSPTNGDSSIAQTFTVPSGDGSLTFWYNVTCPDTVTYDWATATLKDNTTGTTTTPLAKTCVSSSGWKSVTATVVAGQSYTLTLTSHDDNYAGDPTFTKYDDASLGAAPPPPPTGITNGGFETGSLSGWTASGAAHGVTTSGPHSGSYAALLGSSSPTNGDSSIAQTFTAPSGSSALHFWYNVTCPDTVTYDWATATLKDNTTGTTTTVLGKTCVSSSGWVQVNASITAGHSYTLTLTSHDDNYSGDPTFTKYDDVSTS
jgi:serine protease